MINRSKSSKFWENLPKVSWHGNDEFQDGQAILIKTKICRIDSRIDESDLFGTTIALEKICHIQNDAISEIIILTVQLKI